MTARARADDEPGAMAAARDHMVRRDLAARGIDDLKVLEAMRAVPRERFVRPDLAEFAYDDAPLPIEEGQTISQPYIVALMLELAEIGPNDRVLDVGTGSGYAAAVASRIAAHVDTIERHRRLADTARERLRALGYDNVAVHCGDGSRGWAANAPYDAIVVAAGSPAVPESLKRQLAADGRLVIPVGDGDDEGQRLIRVRRAADGSFDEEMVDLVRFVPLIGAEGWEDAGKRRRAGGRAATPSTQIAAAAETLLAPEDPAFGMAFDRLAGARVVLLGEATHGTSEFYRARAAITRRLIERHGFTIVAVEADWPDAARIDSHVRRNGPPPFETDAFARFPTWMWRNREVADFIAWLHDRNHRIDDPDRRAGFFGLDLYSLNASVRAVLDYLDRTDAEAARVARERYGCLTPWQRDPETYGRAALTPGFGTCEDAVLATLTDLLERRGAAMRDEVAWFDAAQNARLVANAERYYRAMYYGGAESWNLRDCHMFETLEALLDSRPGARAVVWAHNSHIGDARVTEMGHSRGELNIGQLCRERFGGKALLVGFGTHAGTVAAASDWDGPVEIKTVRPSRADSVEILCHEAGIGRFLLDLTERADPDLVATLAEPRLERAIGVIYRPETERWSHYFEAALSRQFDHYVWFDETTAVTPLPAPPPRASKDTWPSGL